MGWTTAAARLSARARRSICRPRDELLAESLIAEERGALFDRREAIIATAYAEPASIARAFDLGVYDYLQKDQFFEALLRAKVRNAMEVWRERELAALSTEQREQELARVWQAAKTERDPHAKGELLETVMLLVFRTIPGFEHAQVHKRNDLEEIDVFVQNSSADPFWQREGSYVLVECKNWSSSVGCPS